MTFARRLTRIIDIFYLPPLRRLVPLQTFRYAVCGGVNGIYPTPSNALTKAISVAYSYLMQKYFSFRGCVDGNCR